jgi:hypothetical protein
MNADPGRTDSRRVQFANRMPGEDTVVDPAGSREGQDRNRRRTAGFRRGLSVAGAGPHLNESDGPAMSLDQDLPRTISI